MAGLSECSGVSPGAYPIYIYTYTLWSDPSSGAVYINMPDKSTIDNSTVKQLLQQQRDDFSAMLKTLIDSLNERHDKLQGTVMELTASLEYSQKDIHNLSIQVNELTVNHTDLANETTNLSEKLQDLGTKLDYA